MFNMDKNTIDIIRYTSFVFLGIAVLLFAVSYNFKEIFTTGLQVLGAYLFSWMIFGVLLYVIYLCQHKKAN